MFFNNEVIQWSRYSDTFKRNAVDLLHNVGISKACREVRVTRSTLYRWNREISSDEPSHRETVCTDTITDGVSDPNTGEYLQEPTKHQAATNEDELQQLRVEIDKQTKINRKLKKALMTILSDSD